MKKCHFRHFLTGGLLTDFINYRKKIRIFLNFLKYLRRFLENYFFFITQNDDLYLKFTNIFQKLSKKIWIFLNYVKYLRRFLENYSFLSPRFSFFFSMILFMSGGRWVDVAWPSTSVDVTGGVTRRSLTIDERRRNGRGDET